MEPQLDIVLLIAPECGGQVRISEDDYLEGAPELIAAIAASRASYDLGDKKQVYRRNGVQECIVWQIFENRLDWFGLQEGEYVSLLPDADELIRSRVFPGLWLDVESLRSGAMPTVLAKLQQGIASPEHQDLVSRPEKFACDLGASRSPVSVDFYPPI